MRARARGVAVGGGRGRLGVTWGGRRGPGLPRRLEWALPRVTHCEGKGHPGVHRERPLSVQAPKPRDSLWGPPPPPLRTRTRAYSPLLEIKCPSYPEEGLAFPASSHWGKEPCLLPAQPRFCSPPQEEGTSGEEKSLLSLESGPFCCQSGPALRAGIVAGSF